MSPKGGRGEGVGEMTQNVTIGEGDLKSTENTYYLNGPLLYLTLPNLSKLNILVSNSNLDGLDPALQNANQ
jgi:hypothetical protein